MPRFIMIAMLEHKFIVGLLEPISDKSYQYLSEHSYVIEIPSSPKRMLEKLDAVITRGKGTIRAEFIDLSPNLRVIARCGVGVNNIDVDYATKRKIQVLNTPGLNADTVAEHSLALMLILQRQIKTMNEAVRNNRWADRDQYGGDEIRGKILGIIGFGNIGRRVAKLAEAFGMHIQFWNRSPVKSSYDQRSLEEVLSTSDIVSLHLPSNSDTFQLINKHRLELLKTHALIINTGRGDLIDQRALEQRLSLNEIGGFAADVLTEQPPAPDSILLQLPNVILTPHAASLTQRTFNAICQTSVENVISLLNGKVVDALFKVN